MFGKFPDEIAEKTFREYRKLRAYYRLVSGKEKVDDGSSDIPGVTIEHSGFTPESGAEIIE